MPSINGVFSMLKPPGMSSHELVKLVKNRLNLDKVGHGGTLDPGASGVLPILVGRATKLTSYLLEYQKSYCGEVTLGRATTTDDPEGDKVYSGIIPLLSEIKLQGVLDGFTGTIKQRPPIFSAIKHKGNKYLNYARAGGKIPDTSRTVYIYRCKLLCFWPPHRLLLDISCSKGTYIRSIARDIGEVLGCGAHLSFLIRKSTGPFFLETSYTIEEFDSALQNNQLENILFPPDYCLTHLNKVLLLDKYEKSFINGLKIDINHCYFEGDLLPHNHYRVYNQNGEFLALAETILNEDYKFLKPVKILKGS